MDALREELMKVKEELGPLEFAPEVPLIYTTKGNVPLESLQYANTWENRPDAIVFRETYTLDGEIVKQSVHVYSKRGLAAEAEAGNIN